MYARAHVLVLTSESEGFPKVIAEAMAFGCIPIATAVGAIPEMLNHGECAFLTDPKQCVEETIEYIDRLRQDPVDFTERSKKAYFYAKNHFDSERFNVE
jgi:glycosyltransferase involved in cell wall biosynthesis